MDDAHGKEIYLGHTTVKVPGQRPRCSQQQRSLTQPIMTNGLTKENASMLLETAGFFVAFVRNEKIFRN